MNPLGLLDDVPSEAISAVLVLIGAIIRVVKAGDDAAKREEALMQAAEDVKAELDRLKFG